MPKSPVYATKCEKKIHRQVEARDEAYAEVEAHLTDLDKKLSAGDLKGAQEIEETTIAALNRIPGLSMQRKQRVISELEKVRPKLQKLTSWRHWGTVQAREKVIAEIRTIHESGQSIEKIAKRIQQARDEWREWDKSGEGGDKKLYDQFDEVCREAYKPCQAHFDRLKKQRAQNRADRENICEKLENTFAKQDWRDPDWKQLQKLVRDSVTTWRKTGQAEFKHRKALQARFDSALAQLDDRLDRERKRCLKRRENLIESIHKLAEAEDSSQAIRELTELKKQWTPTVTGKRGEEQKLWQKFTRACDAVYDKRNSEKKQFLDSLKQNLKTKAQLCETIEQAVSDADEAEDLDQQLNRWKAQLAGGWQRTKIRRQRD